MNQTFGLNIYHEMRNMKMKLNHPDLWRQSEINTRWVLSFDPTQFVEISGFR